MKHYKIIRDFIYIEKVKRKRNCTYRKMLLNLSLWTKL